MHFMCPSPRSFSRLFIFTACLAMLAATMWPASAVARSDHCESDKEFMAGGTIYEVTIEDLVDRDGDGYASSFIVRVRADSRQLQPRQQGKGLMKAFHNVVTGQIGIPLPFAANKRCLDLVPGYKIVVQTEAGEWIDWGHRHINNYDDYPGPGAMNDYADFYVFEGENAQGRILNAEGEVLLDPRRPDDNQLRRFFVNDGDLTNGDRAVLRTMEVHTCWKPMGRMGAADADVPKMMGCIDPSDDFGDDITDAFRQAIADIAPDYQTLIQLDERFEGGLKVEIPRLDKKAELSTEQQTPTDTPVVTATVRGEVLTEEEFEGISRADIVFDQKDGDVTRTVTSSTDGTYSIKLPVGTYEVRVDQELYHATTTTVVVSQGGNPTSNFFLTPDEESLEAASRTAEMVEQGRGGVVGERSQPTQDLPEPGDMTSASLQERVENLGAPATRFAGVWDTQHGELRLHQVNGHVIGDYADRGVILGNVQGSCVAGVFTNGGRSGLFRFEMKSDDAFEGRWAWHGEPLQNDWNGDRIASEAPTQLHNFTRGDATTQSVENERTVYDGAYQSDHGRVELLSRDLFLIGDYADRGILAGMWDGDSYVGRFTDEGRTGWFDLAFYSKGGSFRQGSRGWIDGGDGQGWALDRVDDATPRIDNPMDAVSCPGSQ